MRRAYFLTTGGVLTACLALWVALAGAQPPIGSSSDPGPFPPLPGTTQQAEPNLAMPPVPRLDVDPNRGAPAPLPSPSVPLPAVLSTSTPPEQEAIPPLGVPLTTTPNRPLIVEDRYDLKPTSEPGSGSQESSVSLEWVGTAVAKIGSTSSYSLVVRNTSNVPLQQVLVRVRIPEGLSVQGMEPRALTEGGLLAWDLGTMPAKQERALQLRLRADAKGDVIPQAWVTFTGTSSMRVQIREPKLQLRCSAAEKVLLGEAASFTLTVSNPGDGSTDAVKLRAVLSDGLEHARGNQLELDVGNLAPGESRNVTLLCATRADGLQTCTVTAEAEGGLTAKDTASLNVVMPRLDLQLVGPRLRYLDRKAIYAVRVTNPGDAPASNVTVADVVPAGFRVLAASDGGRHDVQTRTVSWFLGEIGPGQTREVKLEVQAVNPGEHEHRATAVAARGLRAETKLTTRVEGLSALLVEMVDTEDPIEAGGDTAYEVKITNTGSKTENDIKLVATIPDKMQFKNAQGPVRYVEQGKTITFEPIPALAPRADAIIRINVKAVEAGTVRFKIQVTSQHLTEPVVQMEATRIYSDTMDAEESLPLPTRPNLPGSGGPVKFPDED